MQDRRSVRGALWRGATIEIVDEDGFHRAIGARADRDGAFRRRLDALGPIGSGEPDNAETGAKALLGMRPLLQDRFAERRRGRPMRRASARMRSIVQLA